MVISAEELQERYLSKRISFASQLQASSNDIVRQKLLNCTLKVDLCLKTMIDLSESLPKVLKFYRREMDEAQAAHVEMVSHLKNGFAAAETISIPELRDTVTAQIDWMVASHCQAQEMRYALSTLKTQSVNLSLDLAQDSLLMLLESNDSVAILEAVKKLILNLLGLVPGGNLFPGLYDIYQLVNSRDECTAKANEYFNELDTFLFAAFQWCTATQLLIDLINALEVAEPRSTPLPVDEAIGRVNARFDGIVGAFRNRLGDLPSASQQ